MVFNTVIGNPPYNNGMDLDFVDIGFKLSTDSVCMITPAKWQTAEADQKVASKNINYGQFREKYVPHMRYVCFYPDCKDIFDIYQVDGISWYIVDKEKHDVCTVVNKCNKQNNFNSTEDRNILNRECLINIGNEIISYVHSNPTFKQFNFGYMGRRYKTYTTSKISGGGLGCLSDTNDKIYCLSISRIIDSDIDNKPEQECSQSFSADTWEECESFVSYINTRFVRFFIMCNVSKLSGVITDDYFRFVPAPPSGKFDHLYTDEELYKAFNLPQKYIDVIESIIKERK